MRSQLTGHTGKLSHFSMPLASFGSMLGDSLIHVLLSLSRSPERLHASLEPPPPRNLMLGEGKGAYPRKGLLSGRGGLLSTRIELRSSFLSGLRCLQETFPR